MDEQGQRMQRWLDEALRQHDAVAGTLHLRRGEVLALCASVNIPATVQALVREIPKGKGMAGLAWERDAPVQTCNLQTDDSGDVRPGARAVAAQASVAVPIHDARGEVCGVVGFAYRDQRELGEAELERCRQTAEAAPRDEPIRAPRA